MNRFPISFFLLCLWFSANCLAALPRFVSVNDAKQLPDKTIRDLVKDNSGFLWGATNRGVFRYDGYEIKTQLVAPDNEDLIANLRINSL